MEMPCVSISGKRKVMLNRFCRKPLYEVTRILANVATGVEKAQLVTFRFADLFPL